MIIIDEADGMLGKRENAARSWEISHVNEMLTGMENLRGILICSTNFKSALDCAGLRRFNIKLQFDYCTAEGALTFYKKMLSPLVELPLSGQETSEVKMLRKLTAGDFKVVYQKFYLLEKKSITHSTLINALKEEVAQKSGSSGRVMGFRKE